MLPGKRRPARHRVACVGRRCSRTPSFAARAADVARHRHDGQRRVPRRRGVAERWSSSSARSRARRPSRPRRSSHNIAATRRAFGLSQRGDARPPIRRRRTTAQARHSAPRPHAIAQIRLLDPNRLSPTFNVKQQVQVVLRVQVDARHRPLPSRPTTTSRSRCASSTSPACRLAADPGSNTHLVYTHGYGVVARTTTTLPDGLPNFVEKDLPPTGPLPITQPRIYFGQMSPSYSIVGAPAGSTPKEFDRPSARAAGAIDNTYDGGGGVPIGSFLHRRRSTPGSCTARASCSPATINSDSQLLTVRNPRARVAAVAPWLTLDGDTYPTVVDGQIVWVVDGYTTSNNYPVLAADQPAQRDVEHADSERLDRHPAEHLGQLHAQLGEGDGRRLHRQGHAVRLEPAVAAATRSWQTWEKSFPGLVQPQIEIPAALLAAPALPAGPVQRAAQPADPLPRAPTPSSSTAAATSGRCPNDPTVGATTSTELARQEGHRQRSDRSRRYYMSLSPRRSTSAATFSLSSPLVTLNGRNLAAFLSVDSQPGRLRPVHAARAAVEPIDREPVADPERHRVGLRASPSSSPCCAAATRGSCSATCSRCRSAGRSSTSSRSTPRRRRVASFPILQRVIAIYGNGARRLQHTLEGALHRRLAWLPTRAQLRPPQLPATSNPRLKIALTTRPTTSKAPARRTCTNAIAAYQSGQIG